MTMIRTVTAAGAAAVAALFAPALAHADDLVIPPQILDTTCSLDQLMAATQQVTPLVYSDLIAKYQSEPPWIQGGVVFHMNRLLQKPPAERQQEIDTLVEFVPQYTPLFVMAEPVAEEITAACPTFPEVNPAVWNPPPAPDPAPAPPPPPAPAPPPPAQAQAPAS